MTFCCSVRTTTLTSSSSSFSFVAATALFATSNSPPLTILHIACFVTNNRRYKFNSDWLVMVIISSFAESLLILSTGIPLSLNFPKGMSDTLIVCNSPILVKTHIFPVFLHFTIYFISAWTVSLLRSYADISIVLQYPKRSIRNITSVSSCFLSS